MDGVAFYLLAAGTLAAAFGAASGSRLLHSALLLTAAFIGTGCLYILLDADFLGAVQFMVYSGGIAVLIVLGIMLTHRPSEEKKGQAMRTDTVQGSLPAVLCCSCFCLCCRHRFRLRQFLCRIR